MVAPGDVVGELDEQVARVGAIGAVARAACVSPTRRSISALDLLERAGADEQVLERGDLVGVEVRRTEPPKQCPVGGSGSRAAIATSGVALPSRRSSPTGLPVTSASPNAPSTSSRSWNASPSGSPIALSVARSSSSRPASAAPRCSGRSTVYFADLYSAMRRAASGAVLAVAVVTRSSDCPTHSSMRSSS